jgi:hypothetical protein
MIITLKKRRDEATEVQRILTAFGCIIQMRLGLHETGDTCAENGLILLHLLGSDDQIGDLQQKLEKVEGVAVNQMDVKYKN